MQRSVQRDPGAQVAQPKRLLVFGATGGTGREVVRAAAAAGHLVTAFARRAEVPGAARVVVGDALDADAVAGAIAGHDAVICALGAPASSPDRLRERATRHILAGMQAAGVRRLVALSTYGLGGTWPTLPWFVRHVVIPFHLQRGFADHVEQEMLIRESPLDWTIVRPPFLVDGPPAGGVRSDDLDQGPTPKWKISRADVARVLVDRALDGGWARRAVPVTW
jgi:uncharacterized protein YbjT (DUF2867 family)